MTGFIAILETLVTHKVDVIVVGGVSAVLNGAPVMTLDLDVVHSRTPANVGRLLIALAGLDAEYRYTGDENSNLTRATCRRLATNC
jgi:hypothetical protein